MTNTLSHFDFNGMPRMVNVSQKAITSRTAIAIGKILMKNQTIKLIKQGQIAKGDVLSVSATAGILAAKKTPELIPMSHPLMIESCQIDFQLNEEDGWVSIRATVSLEAKTGVEMEALTAVSVAALTIYDMCKSVDKEMIISDVQLIRKTGGKSGDWQKGQLGD